MAAEETLAPGVGGEGYLAAGHISFVMEDAMVSTSTGAMNSVLTKLETLMGERYAEVTGTDEQELVLRGELQIMNALLKQLSNTSELNIEMKECRNQMRELTYDIDDSIDDLMVGSVKEKGSSGRTEQRVVPHDFIDQIQKLNAQVEKEDLRSMVPKTEIRTFQQKHKAREQWLSKVYDEGNNLVGIDGPRDDLVRQLIDEGQDSLQGVCIFGAVGIGKTTLATQVYNEIKSLFSYCAYIAAYHKTDKRELCKSILRQLEVYIPERSNPMNMVKNQLRHERFIIVMDGVSSSQILEDMKVILPQDTRGSRIIITTHLDGVAEYCCEHFSSFIYTMNPLSYPESLSLFRSIIFGPARSSPSTLKEVHDQIVETCRGMPLAITLISGLFASKPVETAHWRTVEKQLKSVKGNHLSVEWMRKIFEISYADLLPDMKTCLLYLSSFPADCVIRKERLIRRWAAERFLPKRSVESWWETGKNYFFELIARKLIEPVYYDYQDVLPTGCKVGHSVHDFIRSQSDEENFVISGQLGVFWRDCDSRPSYEEQEEALFNEEKKRKVRSLTFDVAGFGGMPELSAFGHVRMLDLEGIEGLDEKDLRSVGCLSLLRYLGLAGTRLLKSLPQEIIALEHLETVDLMGTSLRELPTFKSKKLVSLIGGEVKLPRTGMGEMQELEELSGVIVRLYGGVHDDCIRLAEVVKQSKRLRRLGVRIRFGPNARTGNDEAGYTKKLMDLLDEIGNSNIQYLCIDDWLGYYTEAIIMSLLLECWAQQRPRHLKEFRLSISYSHPEVPRNMSPSLVDVTHLTITVERVDPEGLRILGDLPNLVYLSLITKKMTERSIISKNGFRCFRGFRCRCTAGGMALQFEAGAMSRLRTLRLEFNVKETESEFGGVDLGIQFLACLVQVHAIINCDGSTAACVEAVEAAMRDQVSQNPNNPVLEIRRNGEDKMVQDMGRSKKHTSSVEDPKDMKMQWLS